MSQYLLDTSAFWQARLNAVAAERVRDLTQADELVACTPAILEMLVGARTSREWLRMRAALDTLHRVDLLDPAAAVDLQGALATKGQHRTPVIDVLVAATAAEHDLTVLHYDRDFERLTEITGGQHEWVVPAGSGH